MPLPDLHPSVVHYPIAFLLLGSAAGLLYLHWRPSPALRTLTWIPLLLGWVGAWIAVLTGLLAQSGLPPGAPYRPVLDTHVYLGFGVAILYAIPLYRWWLHSKRKLSGKRKLPGTPPDLLDTTPARRWLTLIFVLGILLVLLAGAYGGQLVHEWGVNVNGV